MSVEFSGRNVRWTPTLKELAEERAQSSNVISGIPPASALCFLTRSTGSAARR